MKSYYSKDCTKPKKLVVVLTISTPLTTSLKTLLYVLCIYYLVQFIENKIYTLINFGSKVKVMILTYTAKLSLTIWKTSIRVQKTDGSPLETYGMALSGFLLQDSLETVSFFEESFLLANTNMKVILRILFLLLVIQTFSLI